MNINYIRMQLMDFPQGTYTGPNPDHHLPNGHTRKEYYDLGFSDMEIDFWGLDQPGAPGPEAAGFVIMDMLEDNDWDGDGGPAV
jgi:hypothetical protein